METMKLLEIHKKGVNAHNKVVSYYGLDYNTKKVLFEAKTFKNKLIEYGKETEKSVVSR